ncbi:MAG TPA: hypothetical protein DFS52_21625 [Myxococcales bacterium]|nr:hypothetical protein [Myxococcales bacterium]
MLDTDEQRLLARIQWCCEHIAKYAAKLGKSFGHGNASFDALCWHLSILGSAASQLREPVLEAPIKTRLLVVEWETLTRLPGILMPDERNPGQFESHFPLPAFFEELVREAIPRVEKAVRARLAKQLARRTPAK